MSGPAPATLSPEAAAKLHQEAFNAAYQEFMLRKPELERLFADDQKSLDALNEASWRLREAFIRGIKDGLAADNADIQEARGAVAHAVAELRQYEKDTQAFSRTLNVVGRIAAAAVKLTAAAV